MPAADSRGLPKAAFLEGRSLNDRVLPIRKADAEYDVLLIGHPYGNYLEAQSISPAHSLLANIGRINQVDPAFIALLGDNVRAPGELQIAALRSQFADVVEAPVFAIPGEHDLLAGEEAFERAFGPRYYQVEFGSELFLMLDTGGMNSTEISTVQWSFFEQAIRHAAESAEIENVILLMHKVIWVRHPSYQKLGPLINNDRVGGFWPRIYPLLANLARSKRVIVGAGDIGHKSYSFIQHQNRRDGITYFATGLADRSTDSIVRLHFGADGSATIIPVSLTDQPVVQTATTPKGFLAWGGGR